MTLMASATFSSPPLDRLREALRLTSLRFVVYVALVNLGLALLGALFNYATSFITDPLGVSVAALLLAWVVGGALYAQAAMARDRALDLHPDLRAAAEDMAHFHRLAAWVVLGWGVVFVATGFLGPFGLWVSLALYAWFSPLAVLALSGDHEPLWQALHHALRATIGNPGDTVPLLLFLLALNAVGLLTLVGLLYTLPLGWVLTAVTYRDLLGT